MEKCEPHLRQNTDVDITVLKGSESTFCTSLQCPAYTFLGNSVRIIYFQMGVAYGSLQKRNC